MWMEQKYFEIADFENSQKLEIDFEEKNRTS